MKLFKKLLSFVLCAIMVLSIVPIGNIEAEATVAYPKIEALKVPRIYQPSSDEIGMCHFNSIACLIAYRKGSYTYGNLSRTYSYGTDYAHSNDPIWEKMYADCNECYDPIENNYYTKYPGNIVTEEVSGNNTQTYKIIYEQLSKGNPVVVYGTGSPNHASVVIGYSGNTNSLDASKFSVMQITKSGNYWPNSKSNFDTYANSPTTDHSKSCYLTLSAWISYNKITLTRITYYKDPCVEIDKSYSKYSISETNAVLCGKVMNPKLKTLGNCGIKLYDESGNLLKECKESISNLSSYSVVNLYYDVNKELKYTLKKGTKYSYQFFAVVNGTTYYSAKETFSTKGANTLSVYYNANGGSISSDTYYLSSGDIYKSSDNSKHCQKWTYNEPQKYGLYDNTTFGIYRNGYEFLGWSTTPSGELWFDQNDTGLLPTHLNADIKNGDCSVTMYAVWKKVSSSYTLSYNANGGSGAPSSQSGAASYTISSTVPVRSGYTFIGWSTSSNAASATYFAGESITLTQNTTLYAVWKEIPVYNAYELVYDANGGSGAPEFQTFIEGETITVSDEIPVCFGYEFNGWYTADGEWYYPGDEAVFYENTTLYASWKTTFSSIYSPLTLWFDDETDEHYVGFVPEQSGYYVIETIYTEDCLDTIGKLYTSLGDFITDSDDNSSDRNFRISYYLNEDELYFVSVESFDNISGSTTLKITAARDVVFDANGGYGAPQKLTGDYRYILPFEEPHRDGYVFMGWTMNKNTNSDIKQPGDTIEITGTTITGVTTLYAVWEKTESPTNPNPDDEQILSEFLTIRTPSVTEINYGDSIFLHVDLNRELPEGWYVKWTSSNDNFGQAQYADNRNLIFPKKSGDTVFTVTLYDNEGNVICSDTQVMTAKAGFFQKIIAFFKNLFGLTKTISEAFNYAY